jgi:transposase
MKKETRRKIILVYIDESGMKNEYAWSPRGKSVNDERKRNATEKLNIIAPMIYECSTNAEIFNFWRGHSLLSEILENSLIAMDNASFHKSEKTKELVEKFSCRLLFLPPYSPDLNQIEKFLASMKAKIKK